MAQSTSALPAEVRQAIVSSYGPNLAEPQYHFVLPRMAQPLYGQVADELRQLGLTLSDQTDTNTDVSFQWLLSDGQWRGLLELSVVGPFAVLSRLDAASARHVVSSGGLLPVERNIVNAVARHGFKFLTPAILRLPVTMPFENADPGTVYAALFADDYVQLN